MVDAVEYFVVKKKNALECEIPDSLAWKGGNSCPQPPRTTRWQMMWMTWSRTSTYGYGITWLDTHRGTTHQEAK